MRRETSFFFVPQSWSSCRFRDSTRFDGFRDRRAPHPPLRGTFSRWEKDSKVRLHSELAEVVVEVLVRKRGPVFSGEFSEKRMLGPLRLLLRVAEATDEHDECFA